MAIDHVGSTSTTRGLSDVPPGSGPAVRTRPASSGDRVLTLRLPLISATFTRPAHPDRQVPTPGRPVASRPLGGAVPAVAGVPLPRLAFYAGAVVLGALEVVEWPVTLLVVAGTYLADHVRGPAAPGPGDPEGAGAAVVSDGLDVGGPVPPVPPGPPAVTVPRPGGA